jgi:hypothetical protein
MRHVGRSPALPARMICLPCPSGWENCTPCPNYALDCDDPPDPAPTPTPGGGGGGGGASNRIPGHLWNATYALWRAIDWLTA